MFSQLYKKVFTARKARGSSEFSRFFTEAGSREQKKVFLEAARRANARQMETYKKALEMK